MAVMKVSAYVVALWLLYHSALVTAAYPNVNATAACAFWKESFYSNVTISSASYTSGVDARTCTRGLTDVTVTGEIRRVMNMYRALIGQDRMYAEATWVRLFHS
jgi:hypothetical protein